MEFRSIRALRGPNIWARFPVLEVVVEWGGRSDVPPDLLAGFSERLLGWLPTLNSKQCVTQDCSSIAEGLKQGLSLAVVLERVTRELQTLAGSVVGFSRTIELPEPDVFKLAVQYREENVGRVALQVAKALLLAALHDQPFEVTAEIQKLRAMDQQTRLGPSTGSIVRAAEMRGIPTRRLNEGSLVQFGHGVKQHRILAAETDRTSAIAESIAQDKELTKMLLKSAGVPVPDGRPVEDENDAWEAACEIGLPVVVKPQYGNQGRGVAVNLTTREQVIAAYHAACEEGSSIIVEKYAPGCDHRLLIVGEKLVAAAKREPPQVIGDGVHTIAQLVEVINQDPRRGENHATPLSKLRLDAIGLAVLAEQGLTPEFVPAVDQIVPIRRNANLSTGGSANDVTDLVHPQVAARAIAAAKVIGLDIAGVDVVCVDISQPLEEQHGVIVEVNAAPGLRMHLEPSAGQPRPVGEAIVNTMFPPGETGRVPIVSVTGVNGKTTVTRLIAHIFRCMGKTVGLTSTEGIYINDQRIDSGDCSGPKSARMVLMNPYVEAAVLETARGGILREGLGFDQCDVAIVTNIGEGDHLGLGGIDTLDQLAAVKRVIVEAVANNGSAVLNADDPYTAAMAPYCRGTTIFFSRNPESPVIVAHRKRGGRAVIVRNDCVYTVEGEQEYRLCSLRNVPLTHGGLIGFQVENVIAAVAAAWHLGIPAQTILSGLESYVSQGQAAPARFNVMESNGATVIIDYGHNSSALFALVEAVQRIPHERRLIVYTAAGDRRDCDIIRQAEILANAFDHIVIYEDQCTRGRPDGEVIRLMREGLSKGTRAKHIHETRGELKAIESALEMLRPGDLIIVQADQVELVTEWVPRYLATRGPLVEERLPVREALANEVRENRNNGSGFSSSSLDKVAPARVLTAQAALIPG